MVVYCWYSLYRLINSYRLDLLQDSVEPWHFVVGTTGQCSSYDGIVGA